MRDRVGRLIGGAAEGMPWLGTFHSIGARMLRRHAELAACKSDFTILDTDDQIRLIKQLLRPKTSTRSDGRRAPAGHDRALEEPRPHARKVTAAEAGELCQRTAPTSTPIPGAAGDGERRRFRRPAVEHLSCSQTSGRAGANISARFRYILVDEYQDTNVAQYLWLRLLRRARKMSAASATTTSRSMAGAAPRWATSCASRRIFPAPRSIRLERNYRSTPISWPPPRTSSPTMTGGSERRCGPTVKKGERSRLRGVWDGDEEARIVGEEIEALQRDGARARRDRDPGARRLPDARVRGALHHLGLPYRVIGGPRFYERAGDPRRARLFARRRQPADDLAFERIINMPRRGIGDIDAAKRSARRGRSKHLAARGRAPRCSRPTS